MRLMPIPSKNPSDNVEFDFEYFASSIVMNIKRFGNNYEKDLINYNKHFFTFL